MTHVLRSIQKGRWYTKPGISWLGENEIQADALKDLITTGNSLSVYKITDAAREVERVAVALAASRDYFKEVDYVLLDLEALTSIGIRTDRTEGKTPDLLVNSWHLELLELTVDKIAALARLVIQQGEIGRILEKRIQTLVIEAAKSGQLHVDMMKPNMQSRLSAILS